MQMNPSPREFNEALEEYIVTFPNHSRLIEYLVKRYDVETQKIIESELSAAVKTTEDYLWSQSSGVEWSEVFELKLFNHVKSSHSWLEASGFSRLLSFSKWLCWHEGLNA
ncbi:hypothetical protein [Thalassolituus marinus]|uniref:Uncharacterized protein n=1 Tax=Thalassolituus marinus TaxID=671053 RepID=A0ABS7ZQR8_9GAMM|nr:hypothetical protein [Thalassolituus marinus]MCA6062690.1 hypothetical protein [Thalassolituus marinus]